MNLPWYNAKAWAWRGCIAFAVAVSIANLGLFLMVLPLLGADTTPVTDDADIVPTTGVEGFSADAVVAFCEDSKTTVKGPYPAPEVGTFWQLDRTKDSIPEALKVTQSPDAKTRLGTHYYNTNAGQDSEPAIINDAAMACIEKRAK